jgi:hypothetical protein
MKLNKTVGEIVGGVRTITNYAALIGGAIYLCYAILYVSRMEPFKLVQPFEILVMCTALAFAGMVLFIVSEIGFMKAELKTELKEIKEAVKHGRR